MGKEFFEELGGKSLKPWVKNWRKALNFWEKKGIIVGRFLQNFG